jgi:translation initiation factor eIF-2B subunit delta
MCFSMGNAIRLLKAKVNNFDIDTPEEEAKDVLLDTIENFLAERVTLAELLISRNAAKVITNGDVILTYGRHKLVEMTLVEAHRNGKKFEILVLDDPYDRTGQQLAKALRKEGILVTYFPHLGGLSLAMERASVVLLGAEAFFANGSMYAPSGTNEIAIYGSDAAIPVIALCETINFDRERIATDALTYNEIDPDRSSSESFRLLFDVTREEHITGIVTENEGETSVAPGEAILSILNRQDITTQS